MLICFVGSPCSGKTTTAAKLFAALKEGGITAEFIGEQARIYIASQRIHYQSDGLTDEDQNNIMINQFALEKLMSRACRPETIVVADSSTINALLYMSPEYQKRSDVQSLAHQAANLYDLVFLTDPISLPSNQPDANRVHSYQQSLVLHDQIASIIQSLPLKKTIRLSGDSSLRHMDALREVLAAWSP